MIAAIYARKSTEQNGFSDEEKSVTRQIEHAKAYATKKGWIAAEEHIYVDDGISGAEFTKRPAFLRLMNSLKPKPAFQTLIMSEESRLGREAIKTAYAMQQLMEAGVRIFFYLEDRERTLDTPTDKVMLSLTAFADELERENARQRTRDAMLRKARAGHVTGGVVFGWEWNPVGVGDVSGDGTADIIWARKDDQFQRDAYQYHYWHMKQGKAEGGQNIGFPKELPSPIKKEWRLIGVGDVGR